MPRKRPEAGQGPRSVVTLEILTVCRTHNFLNPDTGSPEKRGEASLGCPGSQSARQAAPGPGTKLPGGLKPTHPPPAVTWRRILKMNPPGTSNYWIPWKMISSLPRLWVSVNFPDSFTKFSLPFAAILPRSSPTLPLSCPVHFLTSFVSLSLSPSFPLQIKWYTPVPCIHKSNHSSKIWISPENPGKDEPIVYSLSKWGDSGWFICSTYIWLVKSCPGVRLGSRSG